MTEQKPLGPNECDQIRKDLELILEDYRKKTGFHLDIGNMTYTHTRDKITFKTTVTHVPGDVNPELYKERASLATYGSSFGLDDSDFLAEITDSRGKRLRIIGIAPRRKFPIMLAEVGTDVIYGYSDSILRSYLGEKKKAS